MPPSPPCNMAVTIGSQYYPRNPGDKMRIVKILSVLAILLVLGTVAVAEGGQVLLNAAGATFPYPIYSKWFDQYHQAHVRVRLVVLVEPLGVNRIREGRASGVQQNLSAFSHGNRSKHEQNCQYTKYFYNSHFVSWISWVILTPNCYSHVTRR